MRRKSDIETGGDRSKKDIVMLPFQNTGLSAKERAEDLLKRLTLDEKLGMLGMKNEAVPRLGVPAYHWWNEALHGVARNGRATMFPQPIALAATFTSEYAFEEGQVIREEAKIKFFHSAKHGRRDIYTGLTMFAPNINIFRDPRWGRGHETFGECPVLSSLMATSFIRGLQGDDPEHPGCCAAVKHFAAHSGPEALRSSFDAQVPARDLRQTYLYAFRRCVEQSGVKILMTAYNALDGVPMSVNKALLGETLRRDWNFRGVVVSDVGTASYLVSSHKLCKDLPEALAMEVSAGVDVCCELDGALTAHFRTAYDRGILKIEDVERAVRNQLILKFQLGLFDRPAEEPDYFRLECRAHRNISRKISERGVVLLKNGGILPLDGKRFKKIAVVGPCATDIEVLRGNYAGTATKYVTILDGLLEAFGEDDVLYARGCEIMREKTELCAAPGDRLAEAAAAAEHADLVIAVMGLSPEFEGENGDTGNAEAAGDKCRLEYPEVQMRLLDTVAAAGKPLVLLNCSGSAMVIPEEKADAVLQIFYPGPEGGRVVADILTGRVNPSGRLPVTFYRSTAQLPPFEDYAMRGRTYRYCSENILYPFGYGLSYTDFAYSGLTADPEDDPPGGIACRLLVRNTGKYAGENTVLFFFRHEGASAYEPLKQFAGAVRISLDPGRQTEVRFTYPADLLRYEDESGVSHPIRGAVTLMAGDCETTVRRG